MSGSRRVPHRTTGRSKGAGDQSGVSEGAAIGIGQIDPRTCRFLSVTPTMCAVTGHVADELVGKSVASIFHPDDRDRHQEQFDKLVEGEVPYCHIEVRCLRKGGTDLWVSVNMSVVRDEDGQPMSVITTIENLDERGQAEVSLRASEERYRSLFEQAPIGIYRTTPDGRILEANPALLQMLGFPSFEALARRNLEKSGFHPDHSRRQFKQEIEEYGEVRGSESIWMTADGRELFVEEHARVIRGNDGEVLYYEGTACDVTARHAAELRVIALNRLLGTIRELNRLIVRADSRDRLLTEACRIAVEQGRFAMAWIGVADRETGALRTAATAGSENGYLEAVERYSSAGDSSARPSQRALDGCQSVVVDSISSLADRAGWAREAVRCGYGSLIALPLPISGKPFGVLSIFATEPKAFGPEMVGLLEELAADLGFALEAAENAAKMQAAEEELRRSQAQLSNALKLARLGQWEYDVVNDLFTFSDEFYAMLRTSAEELGGYTMSSAEYARRFVHPDDASVVGTEIGKAIETSDPDYQGKLEHRVIFGDGAVGTIDVRFSLVKDEEGRTIRTFGANQDITERRKLEGRLGTAHKMEAVGRLAGGVAHDFNNILQAMLSQVQLLPASLGQRDRLLEIGGELEQHVRRGATLTRQLLLFSKRETSQMERLDLNQVVRAQASMLSRLIRANIAFTLDLAPGPLLVEADQGQLEQVVMNLVLNASYALPKGGELVVRLSPGDAETVELSVEDSGPGVPPAILDKVFEPFFTTKPLDQGTGLGLSVVLGIVTRFEGSIRYRDRPGGGSVFTVTFPRAEAPADGASRDVPLDGTETPRGQGERLLLVEDEPAARLALERSLGSLGYEVQAAGSAEEAEGLPPEKPFDVLISDLMLPGASGSDLATTLRYRWPDLKIILMSGYAQEDVFTAEKGGPVVRFLQKPFDLRSLAQALRVALEGREPG